MDITLFPTKGNLILAKSRLALSKQGYVLLDKKRIVLIREMMELIDNAKEIQSKIDSTFARAYKALQSVNIMLGIDNVEQTSYAIPLESSIKINFRSVMGVEIPIVGSRTEKSACPYGIYSTNSALDAAYNEFENVKHLSVKLAEAENSIYRLAAAIKKSQKRANALKNIMIPRYAKLTGDIEAALEEKEREEFARLKVIKHNAN